VKYAYTQEQNQKGDITSRGVHNPRYPSPRRGEYDYPAHQHQYDNEDRGVKLQSTSYVAMQ